MSESASPSLSHYEPGQYPRRVLLAVCGLSPQIVTETVCALATETPAFVPTEVHLITTREGARRAMASLSDEGAGWLRKLATDYHLPAITFGPDQVHIMQTPDGQDIDDIRTPQDNQYAADYITRTLRQMTQDLECALHVSIAGGRKTMGFYLGYALSLYGRLQDRLSHVLVSAPYESSEEFFYPTPYSRPVTLRDGSCHDAMHARVTLAQLPFVSLRHSSLQALLTGQASYNDTVHAISRLMEPPRLHIDLKARRISASGVELRLSPANLALLSMFARRAMNGAPPLSPPPKDCKAPEWGTLFLEEYHRIVGQDQGHSQTLRALQNGMDGDDFWARRSRLENELRKKLLATSAPYLLTAGPETGGAVCLRLPPEAITYADPEAPAQRTTFTELFSSFMR